MAIFLRNYDAFNDIISYDEASGNWHRITAEQKNVLSSHDISGFFAMLSSKFCGIYSLGRDIFICVGDLRVALNEKIKITVIGSPEKRHLTILDDGKIIGSHIYSVDTANQFENDPTPFIEDEDFDFGLLIANISESTGRQEVFKSKN